jgi:hypothetical protein
MRVELHGGPADGMQNEAPEGVTEIFLTDVGPARPGPDPFEGRSLGQMTYEITERTTEDGAVIFQFVGSTSNRECQSRGRRADAAGDR